MSIYSKKSWSETKAELRECMERWGVRHWDIECETTQYSRSFEEGDPKRGVVVWYVHPETMENLRALFIGINEIRLNETTRGLGDVFRQNYMALPAGRPSAASDPWRVLNLSPNAEPAVVEAAYRALARQRHPDAGGSDAEMAELNAAYAAVKR